MDVEEFLNKFPGVQKENFIITTSQDICQKWFNIALNFCYAFNHEQGVANCEKAIKSDAKATMPYFLASFALGMNYNDYPEQLNPEKVTQIYSFWQKANNCSKEGSEIERDLVIALQARVGDGQNLEHREFDQDFAQAMQNLYQKYQNEPFIICLYAQSLMNLRPWDLWAQQNSAEYQMGDPYEMTEEIGKVLERGLKIEQDHLGMRHLWIHLWEASQNPQKACDTNFKRQMRDLAPSLGHLCHMPAHIDLLTGSYQQAIQNSLQSIEADQKYFKYRVENNDSTNCFYTLDRIHKAHLLAYSACFAGNYGVSYKACTKIIEICNPEFLKDFSIQPSCAYWGQAFLSILLHVYIRFGKWKEIIGEPFLPFFKVSILEEDPQLYCCTLASLRYARGVALAVLAGLAETTGDREKFIRESIQEKEAFTNALQKMGDKRVIFNVKMIDSLKVGEALLQGELLYRMEKFDQAFKNLRIAVDLFDKLPYNEPWGWMFPARHALGALLLEQGILSKQIDLIEQAQVVYQEDIGYIKSIKRSVWNPNNIWSLLGLQKIYTYQKNDKNLEEINKQLAERKKISDLEISVSCMCSVKK